MTTSNQDTLRLSKDSKSRFIDYILEKQTSNAISVQTARFDTLTKRAVFASDLFFKPEELKFW